MPKQSRCSWKPKVAIACQGGGSHAAFAAGVLSELLTTYRERFDLVALSGTSGGALCAALAWAGMLKGDHEDAKRRLLDFWNELAANDPIRDAMNFWFVNLARLPMTLEVSPYAYPEFAKAAIKELLERHLDLDAVPAKLKRRNDPHLLIGATEVLAGERTIFHGDRLSYDMLLASAAVPPIHRAVSIDGRTYWDGLFASNPPIREFTDLPRRPTEIWVVQINPQRIATEPYTVSDIVDRRNELAGNLSLAQELEFIRTINRLRRDHPSLARRYRHIKIRVVELGITELDYASKLDRSSRRIKDFIDNGIERAAWFFDRRSFWPRRGSIPPGSVSHYDDTISRHPATHQLPDR